MPRHHLHSSPETCHWGFFEAKLKPVMTIASGDEVTIDTVSGGPDVVPDRSRFHVPPELADIHARSERMVPGHPYAGGRLGTKDDVRALKQYMLDVSEEVRNAAYRGRCFDDAMREVRLPKYESWGSYKEFFPMNVQRFCEYWGRGY